MLNTLALGRDVAVSARELIEIGGSFRLPEIMERAGCKLREVGTTNRTHPRDFEAVATGSALLLKVHPSNYHVKGFTREVSANQLAAIGKRHEIPTCVDLGQRRPDRPRPLRLAARTNRARHPGERRGSRHLLRRQAPRRRAGWPDRRQERPRASPRPQFPSSAPCDSTSSPWPCSTKR